MDNDYDPTDTFQQESDDEQAELQRKLTQQQQAADFIWLMSDPHGRRIVWRLMAEAGVFQASFNPDAMTMAFKEGQRTAGLKILGQVHSLCPDLYTTMMKEQLQ